MQLVADLAPPGRSCRKRLPDIRTPLGIPTTPQVTALTPVAELDAPRREY